MIIVFFHRIWHKDYTHVDYSTPERISNQERPHSCIQRLHWKYSWIQRPAPPYQHALQKHQQIWTIAEASTQVFLVESLIAMLLPHCQFAAIFLSWRLPFACKIQITSFTLSFLIFFLAQNTFLYRTQTLTVELHPSFYIVPCFTMPNSWSTWS